MKRILINATHAEEIRVALCRGNHLYDFDLENRTREQKKANIYKGHVTRVEPSLEAVFVEYGSERQGFLPMRDISKAYLRGDPRKNNNIRELIKEGDELIVQVEKEERGNKGAALSTYVSLAGRYLVLMPNNASGGGISRQISGKSREEMKRMLAQLNLPKSMSIIVRTAGVGRSQDDLQNDLDHLVGIWRKINDIAKKTPSPCLTHQEAGVVTRAVRDYLRDDIAEVWIDNEQAYFEAYHFVQAVMPHQLNKLKKYLDIEPLFSHFGVETQIETAYQREVKLPSGGSIVVDQTEALVSIDINSAKATRGADIEATATNTNLEAAEEIARQLRLRDMGGLIVIDFIDMNDSANQRKVEQRLKDATQYDRARIQFGQISRFGLMEMSRQRLRPSLEEATGYMCPRCHGTGIIRDLRSLSLSIMRDIEKIALREGRGEVQAEVPIEIGAFLLNEKRDSLVYLEQDSGVRITILPNSHLETPHYKVHFNRDGFAPASYERVTENDVSQTKNLGYDTDWQTESRPVNPVASNYPSETQSDKRSPKQTQDNKGQENNPKTQQHVQAAPAPKTALVAHQPEKMSWIARLIYRLKYFFAGMQAQPTPKELDTLKDAQVNQTEKDKTDSQPAQKRPESQSRKASAEKDGAHKKDVQPKTGDKNQKAQAQKPNKPGKKRRRGGRGRNKPQVKNQEQKTSSNQQKGSQNSSQKSRKTQSELPTRSADSKRTSRGRRERNKDFQYTEPKSLQANVVQKPDADKLQSSNLDPKKVNLNIISTETKQADPQSHVLHINLDGATKTPKQGKSAQTASPNTGDGNETTTSSNQSTPSDQSPKSKPSVTERSRQSVPTTVVGLVGNQARAKNDVRDVGMILADELSQDSVNTYRSQITCKNTASSLAGFTSIAAPTPQYRASNDPRGPVAPKETIAEADAQKHQKHTDTAKHVVSTTEPPQESAAQPSLVFSAVKHDNSPQNAPNSTKVDGTKLAGQLVVDVLGEEGKRMIDEGDFAQAFIEALDAESQSIGYQTLDINQ